MAVALALAAAADDSQEFLFRGDLSLTGVVTTRLPEELAPLWVFDAGEGIESTVAIADGRAFVATLDGRLIALNLASGEKMWSYQAGEEIKSSPSVRQGMVYFGDGEGMFHAVDAARGKALWTFETGAEIISSANFLERVVAAGQSVTDVLFGSYDGFLYSLATADGALNWKLETESYVHATPALSAPIDQRRLAAFGGCDGYFRLVDAASGKQVKALDLGAYVAASAALLDGRAYVGTFDNEVLAIDLEGGKVVWRFQNSRSDFPYYSSPAIASGLVMIGGRDKVLHALDSKTGKQRWSYTTRARIDASPLVVGRRLYGAAKNGELFALDLESGEKLWSYELGEPIVASPSAAAGKLLIATLDGSVYAFAKPTRRVTPQPKTARDDANNPGP